MILQQYDQSEAISTCFNPLTCAKKPDDQHLEEGRNVEGTNTEAKGSNKSLYLEKGKADQRKTTEKTKERLQEDYTRLHEDY